MICVSVSLYSGKIYLWIRIMQSGFSINLPKMVDMPQNKTNQILSSFNSERNFKTSTYTDHKM